MEFFALLSGRTLLNYLLGESVTLMGVFLTMVSLDPWVSSINLFDLFMKFITFSTIICAAPLGKITPVVGIFLPTNLALFWHEIGLKIAWLKKWRRVFERDVGRIMINERLIHRNTKRALNKDSSFIN